MSRIREVLATRDQLLGLPMGVPHDHRRPTTSGDACLVEVNDLDAHELSPDEVLVTAFAFGFSPVVVERVKIGIAGESGSAYEVPVIEARIHTGQLLAFAPDALCRIREART